MKQISATHFKARCLALLDRVDAGGLVITKHGKPVATLYPVRRKPAHFIGSMRGKIKIKGDLLSTGLPWDAES